MRPQPRPVSAKCFDRTETTFFGFVWEMGGYHQIVVSAGSLFVGALAVVPVEINRRIIDGMIDQKNQQLVLALVAVLLIVTLINAVTKIGIGLYQSWLSQSALVYCRKTLVQTELERRACQSTTHGSNNGRSDDEIVDNHPDRQVGTTASVLGTEISEVCDFVGSGISELVANVASLVFALAYMTYVEPKIALISSLLLIPQLFSVPLVQKPLNRLVREQTEQTRALSQSVVNLTDLDHHDADGFRMQLIGIYWNRLHIAAWKLLGKAIVNLVNSLAVLNVLAVGSYLYFQGQTTVGVIVAFTVAFQKLADPISALATFYRTTSMKVQRFDKIVDWMRQGSASQQEIIAPADPQ
ncbi:ABC transporter transmembrane region [Sulfitobacter marinus]|uniref:ABC transporter transmembrane region n=1 Tax=Sulfitobacter marinus TaxID=394264 RepID=A0A1I6UK77_9RHOB|nr:ABC transporter transmembrane domain-containing protein [Sulfitobacter marinus]SFT01811.1 ABC transporter transmembrane region [Sulfitobacter marinus]